MVGSGSTNNPLINEEGYDGQTIRTARYRYTEWAPLDRRRDTLVELYDLEQDPMEYTNLSDEPSHSRLLSEFSERLARGWEGERPPHSDH
ncbi:MAG TPA: hypothetical protein DHV80_05605 [Acidimicrobiaceae bacterium]|nr:hypothetical protein [Acidimicrobiaceae bacterium]